MLAQAGTHCSHLDIKLLWEKGCLGDRLHLHLAAVIDIVLASV